VNDCIARYEQQIEELGQKKYGHTTLLRQVKGVGPITSLAYVLTLEDPQRFSSSREVGPYLGLVPKQEDSGDSQPQLGISKAGDRMLRRLLVGSAQYLLGAFGPDSDLRRYGLRLCERGGKNAKKRCLDNAEADSLSERFAGTTSTRLVRVIARSLEIAKQMAAPNQPGPVPMVMGPGLRSNPNVHRAPWGSLRVRIEAG